MTNQQWFTKEMEIVKQFFELGVLSNEERKAKELIIKKVFISQVNDSL